MEASVKVLVSWSLWTLPRASHFSISTVLNMCSLSHGALFMHEEQFPAPATPCPARTEWVSALVCALNASHRMVLLSVWCPPPTEPGGLERRLHSCDASGLGKTKVYGNVFCSVSLWSLIACFFPRSPLLWQARLLVPCLNSHCFLLLDSSLCFSFNFSPSL